MSKLKLFLIGFLLPAIALGAGAVRQGDNAYSEKQAFSRNFVKNYGAESGVANVSASGTATVVRNTTTPLEGKGDFSITLPNNATDGVTWTLDTLGQKLKGQNCQLQIFYTASSIGSNVQFQVLQGSNLVVSSGALAVNTNATPVNLNAPCGDLSSATTVRVNNVTGNSGTSALKVDAVYYGLALNLYQPGAASVGGTVTTVGAYTIHTFTSSGTFIPYSVNQIDYLVVAGGGGGGTGGNASGGGGGAGGLLTANSVSVSSGVSYSITVGSGGTAGVAGGNSSIGAPLSITATGGGQGGSGTQNGFSGGSGGGAGNNGAGNRTGGAGTGGQGNNGGGNNNTGAPNYDAGGGGGCGAVGNTPGNGGAGCVNSLSGTPVTYACGGGGGLYSSGTTSGGCSSAGQGSVSSGAGIGTAAANSGSGGGGANGTGGTGGSGIVIIRYLTPMSFGTLFSPTIQALSWSGYHDNDCSWTNSSGTYTDSGNDATCTFTERTNKNFGTVTSAGSNSAGIVFTPKRTGTYKVCASPHYWNDTSTGTAELKLTDGTSDIALWTYYMSGASAINDATMERCGLLNVTSLSQLTVKIQMKAPTGNTRVAGISSSKAIEWTIFAIDQNIPAPVLVGSVGTLSNTPLRIETAIFTSDGSATTACAASPCGAYQRSSDWVSSTGVTRSGTGTYSLAIASGVFSERPVCEFTNVRAGNILISPDLTAGTWTSTTVPFYSYTASSGGAVDSAFQIICRGKKGSL